jgi:hypothetical protein
MGYLLIQYLFRAVFKKMAKDATPVSMEQLYDYLKHGDIVNTNSMNINRRSFYDVFYYFNSGLCHCMLIIEENGVKYVIHTHANNYPIYKPRILDTYREDVLSSEWHIVKEPLIEFLHTSEHSLYHIYRPPPNKKPIRIKQLSFSPKTVFNKSIYYCTLMISDLLVQHGHIPPSNKYYSYRTDELVQSLKHNGYKLYTVSY